LRKVFCRQIHNKEDGFAVLCSTLPKIGEFDLVFLRNMMIYFDDETKRQVVRRIMAQLKSGGHLLIGHSESLNGIVDELKQLMPSVYLKP